MRDLAPHILRQRLLVEGFYERNVDEASLIPSGFPLEQARTFVIRRCLL